MEFSSRKTLRLQNYDYSSNGAYFVTLCTQNKARVFWRGNDPVLTDSGRMVLQWLNKIPEKFPGVDMDSYAIMPDHIHFILLFQNTDYALPQVMKWFKAMTTNDHIRNIKAGLAPTFSGHFWQRSYYEHVIRNSEDLAGVRKYISENPLKGLL